MLNLGSKVLYLNFIGKIPLEADMKLYVSAVLSKEEPTGDKKKKE